MNKRFEQVGWGRGGLDMSIGVAYKGTCSLTHRVAMATFWRTSTFHHDGKNQPKLVWVGGARPPPFTISTITYIVVEYALQLRGQMHPPCISTLPLFILCGLTSGRRPAWRTWGRTCGRAWPTPPWWPWCWTGSTPLAAPATPWTS